VVPGGKTPYFGHTVCAGQVQSQRQREGMSAAFNRATATDKLAEGKLLYSMVLSDDSMKFETDSAKLSPRSPAAADGLRQKAEDRISQCLLGNPGPHRCDGFRSGQPAARRGTRRSSALVHEPAWRVLESHVDDFLRESRCGGRQQEPSR
jgi:hypothetical protein